MVNEALPIDTPILLDDDDLAYLNLTKGELSSNYDVFKELLFYDPESTINNIIKYSYGNWAFAAKVFLNVDLLPFQAVTIDQFFNKNFFILVATRGFGKSYLLAVYALLRAIFKQGSKIILMSRTYRQSRIIFNYINDIYLKSVTLQGITGAKKPRFDIAECKFIIGESQIVSLPLGDGEKIRGYRGNVIICDEYPTIPEHIFNLVIRGFSAVSMDPVDKVKEDSRKKALIKAGVDISDDFDTVEGNQIILSGTADYQFNHFFKWCEKYKAIISCGDDKDKLQKLLMDDISEDELKALDSDQFGLMTVPYTELPSKYLDEGIIAQGRATMSQAEFDMEFMASFHSDSDGFIPMSLLKAVSMYRPFKAELLGSKDHRYIMGVDPARKRDNFSIVLLKIDDSGGQHKIVYAWATNEKKMKKSGEVNQNQTYYGACAKKIRQLLKMFNTCLISCDAGGGGREIANYLQEKRFLKGSEKPIWEIDNPDHRMYDGDHILKLVDSSSSWVVDANHSFRKSIEEFQLLFPLYDVNSVDKEYMENSDEAKNENRATFHKTVKGVRRAVKDSFTDVNNEIDEMKKEISSIVVTATTTGRQHFDLPKLTTTGNQAKIADVRRKDRYSACLLAHHGLTYVVEREVDTLYDVVGGAAGDLAGNDPSGPMYRGLPTGVNYTTTGNTAVIKSSGGRVVY